MANPLARYALPALGLAGGALAGHIGAKTTGEAISPGFSQDARYYGATGASAILGLLLGSKVGRRALGVMKPDLGSQKLNPETGMITATRNQIDVPRAALVGAAPFAAIPLLANAKDDVGRVSHATQTAFDTANQAKALVGNAKDDYDAVRENFDPKNLARDVGLSVGGGVAGYLGGGAVGHALGKFIAPDDETASYEKRRRAEKIRDLAESVGSMGLSTIGSIAAPWAYSKFAPKTAEFIGR